jgi:hypothetical protein
LIPLLIGFLEWAIILGYLFVTRIQEWITDHVVPLLLAYVFLLIVVPVTALLLVGLASWFYYHLTAGVTAEEVKRQRLQTVLGRAGAFVYGAGLYYLVAIFELRQFDAGGVLGFLRHHFFDGFTCAALITVGLVLVEGNPSSRADRELTIAYFVATSLVITLAAAFVIGADPATGAVGVVAAIPAGILLGWELGRGDLQRISGWLARRLE